MGGNGLLSYAVFLGEGGLGGIGGGFPMGDGGGLDILGVSGGGLVGDGGLEGVAGNGLLS